MSERTLAVIGASGHGKVVAEIAILNGYNVVFFDDAYPVKVKVENFNVIGDTSMFLKTANNYSGAAVGIGDNHIRKEKLELLLSNDVNLPVLVHPNATVSDLASLGDATVVSAGAIVNPFSKVGRGVIINSNAVVEHDCDISNYVHICPGVSLAGGCVLGELAWIGIGTVVRQCIKIGESSVLGAGSVVVKDIPAGVTAFGNPAKICKV